MFFERNGHFQDATTGTCSVAEALWVPLLCIWNRCRCLLVLSRSLIVWSWLGLRVVLGAKDNIGILRLGQCRSGPLVTRLRAVQVRTVGHGTDLVADHEVLGAAASLLLRLPPIFCETWGSGDLGAVRGSRAGSATWTVGSRLASGKIIICIYIYICIHFSSR